MKYLLIFLPGLFLGCASRPPVPYDILLKSLEKTPFQQTIDQYPYRLTLTYRPDWAEIRRDVLNGDCHSIEDLKRLLVPYHGGVRFILKIGPHPDLSPGEYRAADIVNYQPNQEAFSLNLHHLMYGLDDYIYMVDDRDMKIPVSMYQLERTWGIGSVNYFSLLFPNVVEGRDLEKASHFQVVVQNLNPQLAEARFFFGSNPIHEATCSLEELMTSIELMATQKPSQESKTDQPK